MSKYRFNPDSESTVRDMSWQEVGARTAGKMLARKFGEKAAKKAVVRAGVKVGGKTASKYVPGVGWVLMAVEAAPVAVHEGKRLVTEVGEQVGRAKKVGQEVRRRGAVKGSLYGAGQAVKESLRTQFSTSKAISRTGLAAVTARELAEATYYEDKALKKNPASDGPLYASILAHLRALQWYYWSSHWTVGGASYYGDHLLFQKLYEGLNESIDELGERMVSYFGVSSVNPMAIQSLSQKVLMEVANVSDPMFAALKMEDSLRSAIKKAWKANQDHEMYLGLDDFLMGLSNERDTAIYLLERRTAGLQAKSNSATDERQLVRAVVKDWERKDIDLGAGITAHVVLKDGNAKMTVRSSDGKVLKIIRGPWDRARINAGSNLLNYIVALCIELGAPYPIE